VTICNAKAPGIADDMSAKTGWDVGHTRLTLRSPDGNAPDASEQAGVLRFEERKAAGESVETIVSTRAAPRGRIRPNKP
jgi:hypothetical protein